MQSVKKVLIDDRPASAEQCVEWARLLLEENYNFEIRQLLHNFPPNQLTSHGIRFWSGAKRCPHPISFDGSQPDSVDFVTAAAYLRAVMYNLKPIEDRATIIKIASGVTVPKFNPKSGVRIAVTDAEAQQMMDEGTDGKKF